MSQSLFALSQRLIDKLFILFMFRNVKKRTPSGAASLLCMFCSIGQLAALVPYQLDDFLLSISIGKSFLSRSKSGVPEAVNPRWCSQLHSRCPVGVCKKSLIPFTVGPKTLSLRALISQNFQKHFISLS